MEKETYPFQNYPLPYGYSALEPYIDTKTMMLHHDKHLGAYVNNLNAYLETQPQLQTLSLEELLTKHSKNQTILNNAGGVYNHRFFFESLRPGISQITIGLSSKLLQAFQRSYGTFDSFKEHFSKAAMSVFGSGYAWLCLNPNCQLEIITTANQENPLTKNNKLCPLLCIDVWEHAYYLKHYNERANYIKNFFYLVDWVKVSNRMEQCLKTQNCIG